MAIMVQQMNILGTEMKEIFVLRAVHSLLTKTNYCANNRNCLGQIRVFIPRMFIEGLFWYRDNDLK